MIPHYQIPRNTLLWLFLSQLLVLLPHIQRTPTWVLILWGGCVIWRLQIYRGHWSFPSTTIKILLLLSSACALVATFPGFFGLEALVSTLLAAYGLKLLEMYRKRDALIILYLSFFLITTSFLFEQGIFLTIVNIFTVCIVLVPLIGLYQSAGFSSPFYGFRLACTMVLQAIPIMVLMFVVLPRFPSFWNIPLKKQTPKTGMSDSMSPGDFGRLIQSADPVMRISFSDSMQLKTGDLYWRGLVFSHFDGKRWEPSKADQLKHANFVSSYLIKESDRELEEKLNTFGLTMERGDDKLVKYEVLLEPQQTTWLYALENSIPQTDDIWLNYEGLLSKNSAVLQRFKYSVISGRTLENKKILSDWQRKINLELPESGNSRSKEYAKKLREKNQKDINYIDAILAMYNKDFYYTLLPPVFGNDGVDVFLFTSKKGFCEHFASSFVFLLRAAGIPARVVVGYQGGEYNSNENYYLVRQYDAHAWAEVWIEGEGWVRYDPTFSVAPQRILDGFREAFDEGGELNLPLLSLENYRKVPLVNWLRLKIDSMNYNWARFVLSYDSEKQSQIFSGLFGELSIIRVITILMSCIGAILALTYGFLLWQERDRNPDPVLRAYYRFCKKMSKKGYHPLAAETPEVFLCRLAISEPNKWGELKHVADVLYAYWYKEALNSPDKIKYLCRKLK